ncbi:MAG: hypothetical protein MUO82_11960 [Candidatus Thermoplasmatota archaeon]|nr:hypothetical protein [Candidatus Thermoplasmatota archaeon]
MNAKRKWDMRTILLVLIVAVIIIAIIFVVFSPPGKNVISPLNVQEIMQNKDSYIDKNITIEGYYYISIDGPSLISATTISNPTPSIWLNLDETSLNTAKQEAGNITVSSNLKYRVEGVLQKIESSLGTNYFMKVNKIKAI